MIVETLTLRHYLLFMTKFLPFNGCFLTDSFQVVQAFYSSTIDFSKLGFIMQDCKLLLDFRINIYVRWICRHITLTAHTLVKDSIYHVRFSIWMRFHFI